MASGMSFIARTAEACSGVLYGVDIEGQSCELIASYAFVERNYLANRFAMGEGIVDYETFFNSLKEIGYQGYVGYEMCAELAGGGDVENLDATARKFLEYVGKF